MKDGRNADDGVHCAAPNRYIMLPVATGQSSAGARAIGSLFAMHLRNVRFAIFLAPESSVSSLRTVPLGRLAAPAV